ncbi:hypothetical protein GCM10010166_56320 [Couchioplanes caeruleus subsp. azureus]|nr:hypothetical protein GCM10010166_56320 [Couchioplanes caeruleus subsp. azureus]
MIPVTCHRLFRPPSPFDRLVENDVRNACTHYRSNPLFSAIVAADLDPRLDRDDLVEHFIRVNQLLPRLDVIRALCVLGHGTVIWGHRRDPLIDLPQTEDLGPATFMKEDLYDELVPIYGRTDPSDSPLFELTQSIMAHLFHSVLAPENLAVHYGFGSKVKIPTTPGTTLLPERTLMATLNESCVGQHKCTEHAYHSDGR